MFISESALHGTAQLIGIALVVCIVIMLIPEGWTPWPKKPKKK
jgi:hypothetical protein